MHALNFIALNTPHSIFTHDNTAALGEGIEPPLRAAIADAAHDGLQRVWSDNPKKPIRAATLGALLALYLDYCPEPDDALDALMRGAMHGLLATAVICAMGGRRGEEIAARLGCPRLVHPTPSV